MAELTEEQMGVLKQVEKLMRLAGGTTSAAERESAQKKVQDLLLAYNIDAASIGDGDEGRRGEEKLAGGFYKYERELWTAVAEVNFCIHWTSQDWIERPAADAARKKVRERYSGWAQRYRRITRQHVVGRSINVEATKFMMSYLLEAIERAVREHIAPGSLSSAEARVVGLGESLRSKRASDFREGVALTLRQRLWDRRSDQIRAERERARAEEALRGSGGGDASGTALTIASVVQTERDANMDVVMGEGWSARQRAEQVARAAARRAADEEYTRWAAANPEEARAQEEKRRREERRRASRSSGRIRSERSRYDDMDRGALRAGMSAGEAIGLDPQATHESRPKMIGRS